MAIDNGLLSFGGQLLMFRTRLSWIKHAPEAIKLTLHTPASLSFMHTEYSRFNAGSAMSR